MNAKSSESITSNSPRLQAVVGHLLRIDGKWTIRLVILAGISFGRGAAQTGLQEPARGTAAYLDRISERGLGCNILTRLPSVSKNATYFPTPGISIGSPSTLPPASATFFMDSLISSTAITTEGY